jgi:hypothetical protein
MGENYGKGKKHQDALNFCAAYFGALSWFKN